MSDAWRELLTAEPHELAGIGESPVARAVRNDAAVRAAAARILDSVHAMDGALRSLADAARSAGDDVTSTIPSRRSLASRSAYWRRVTWAAGTLAAASLTALLLVPRVLSGPRSPAHMTPAERPLTATLQVRADRSFAVFATDNPDIAIVWLFNARER